MAKRETGQGGDDEMNPLERYVQAAIRDNTRRSYHAAITQSLYSHGCLTCGQSDAKKISISKGRVPINIR